MPDLDAMWHDADDALLRCLELAHESFLAGGLPVGSVIISPDGARLSEGRNRAYDPAGGADRLQRTPIAHAETEWIIVANLLFLSGVAAYRGSSSPAILRASQREPEVTSLMQAVGDEALRGPALRDCLAPAWPAVQAAAKERRERHGRDAGDADPFDLQRFVTAQDAGGTYDRAVAELRAGRKASHWMWFVFPQIAGLGYSPTARLRDHLAGRGPGVPGPSGFRPAAGRVRSHPGRPARPYRGADLRRDRRAEAGLIDDAVHARRS